MKNDSDINLTIQRNDKIYHYSTISPKMMDYLHTTTLKMLKTIIPILECHQIHYSICGGTLRGAFLTGKFLPWDEDIDLCVLDDDYDRMVEVLLKSVPDWIDVQCKKTEPNYYHGWIKIRDKNSHIFPDEPLYRCNGVLIDIYKLTCAKESEIDYYIANEHLEYLNRRYSVKGITREEREKRINNNNLLNRIDSHQQMKNSGRQKLIVCSSIKTVLDKVECFPTKQILFEGVSVACFKNPEHYLINHYGKNYMILPTKEERKITIERINLNEKKC